MSSATILSRSFRSLQRFAVKPSINRSIICQQQRSFVRISRDSFDEIEDRDLRSTPVSERGMTRDEFEALSEEEQNDIIAQEEEMIENEDDEIGMPQLTEREIAALSESDRELYREFMASGETLTGVTGGSRRFYEDLDEDVDEDVDEDDFEDAVENGYDGEIELDPITQADVKLRPVDREVTELEERFATNHKFGLTDMVDRFEKMLEDRELDERARAPDDVRLTDLKINPSLFAKPSVRPIPRVADLDYSQHQTVERPRVVDSRDPKARRDPQPVLEPFDVRQARTNTQMLDKIIGAGPAVHQTSYIDHKRNNPLTPHWMNMQTSNPELIPPQRGANYEDPTSVKYPFIPVLENPRDLEEASTLHRLLQYNRLAATKKFLKLERVRRQLAYQRQHRDLSAYCKKLCAKLPAERVDLKEVKPKVKNLPTHVSSEYLNEMHPHKIPTETTWMHSLMWLVHDNIKDNGNLSQLEKEQYMRTTQRFCSYAYRQMMKDKAAGYYRVMAMPPMQDTKEEQEAINPTVPRTLTRTQSSFLRQAKILIQQSTAQ